MFDATQKPATSSLHRKAGTNAVKKDVLQVKRNALVRVWVQGSLMMALAAWIVAEKAVSDSGPSRQCA